ncbi:hypothetical protein DFP72DRAFT_1173131 [Ephemerocybe angulata]|uniref:MYND-type domain-containing protein n=1 Tax=Ephemerocybe angulata TaxID=980116 RepID=A0A8H6M3D0_9AGAR|nr:hypothetical protein DFP72DRAFT_1173131 [Tulosesus angulatus]
MAPPVKQSQLMKRLPVKEIIRGAGKDGPGMLACMMELDARLLKDNTVYHENSREILDIFLTFFKVLVPEEYNGSLVKLLHVSLSGVTGIARWCQRPSAPETVKAATSLRLLSASKEYTAWSAWILAHSRAAADKTEFLDSYLLTCSLFRSLLTAFPTIRSELVKDPNMLRVAITMWTGYSPDHPLIYYAWKRNRDPSVDEVDVAMAVFHAVAVANWDGIVDAILDETVCSTAMFVEGTIQRLMRLPSINKIEYLANLPDTTSEIANIRITIMVTHRLMTTSPTLYSMFMDQNTPQLYIKVLSRLTDKIFHLNFPLSGDIIEARQTRITELTKLAGDIVQWPTMTSSSVLKNIKSIMSSGATELLGHSYPLLSTDDTRELEAFDTIFETLRSYALYPQVISFIKELEWYRIGRANDPENGPNPREGFVNNTCLSLHSHFPILTDERERLCDNIHHSIDSTAVAPWTERVCAACHSVAYCSRQCQKADWKNTHRSECPHLRREYHSQRISNARYSYSSRAFHVYALRLALEFNEKRRALPPAARRESLTHAISVDFFQDMDDGSALNVKSVSDYHAWTVLVIPPYLIARFNDLLDAFERMNEPFLQPDSINSEPWNDVGSARLIETCICFGDKDVILVVLLQRTSSNQAITPEPQEATSQLQKSGSRGDDSTTEWDFGVVASLAYPLLMPRLSTTPKGGVAN